MSDMLKSRISHRPERSELVHRHILEDARPGVDPSLCDRQRQLKRAKLANSLASQLSHRPGPLELIQKNILHTDDPVEQAVKEGTIQFRPTADGAPTKPEPFSFEEDSNDTAHSPQIDKASSASPLQVTQEPLPSNITAFLSQFKEPHNPTRSVRSESLGDININQYLSQLNQGNSRKVSRSDSFGGSITNSSSTSQRDSVCQQIGPDGKERKKLKAKSVSKPKMAPKPKTIKFHEYKGPQASLKRKKSCKKSAEQSAYELLLEQQQLFLQWQVENRNKISQIMLPAPPKVELSGRASVVSTNASSSGYISGASSSQASSILTSPSSSVPGTPRSSTPRPHTPTRTGILSPQDVNNATSLLNRIEGMKVSDLKQELKKRSLPVSGSKPTLIERLKPALESIIAAGRQQFQQPFKQIAIPNGGLIILKPSPNSQLVSENESEINSETAFNQVITPERGSEITDCFMKKLILPKETNDLDNNVAYPNISYPTAKCERKSETVQMEKVKHSEIMPEFQQTFDFMEIEQGSCMPPPAPPPPPPPPKQQRVLTDKDIKPKPLPQPPILHPVASHMHPPKQFLPPEQTSQQILLAKAQLETQLVLSQNNNQQNKTTGTTRAGPKGQYIWPPVSLESSNGTVTTVRAIHKSHIQNQSEPSSIPSVPVALSQPCSDHQTKYGLPNILLPTEPVPVSELSLMLSNNSREINNWQTNNDQEVEIESPETEYQMLPATLPSPESERSVHIIENNVTYFNNNLQEDHPNTDYIINQQQRKILELEKALEKSKQQVEAKEVHPPNQVQTSHGVQARSAYGNTKQLLAQQIHNKRLVSKVAQLQGKEGIQHGDSKGAENIHQGLSDINVLFETLMQKQGVPESVEKFGEKITENKCITPTSKNGAAEANQLDFDFGLLPEFPTLQQNVNHPHVQESMDVDFDLDIQDWLDSLVVPNTDKVVLE